MRQILHCRKNCLDVIWQFKEMQLIFWGALIISTFKKEKSIYLFNDISIGEK